MGNFQTKTYSFTKKSLTHIPKTSGVYIYKDSANTVLYVGKAKILSRRISQYFALHDVPEKVRQMVELVRTIDIIQTVSEFDALLLEAKLIRTYQPKYNAIAKDDKSPLYIRISFSEELPRIECIRKRVHVHLRQRTRDVVFGPFQSGGTARHVMRTIRHIIPFCTQKQRNGKKCFYTHIGLCEPCPSFISGLSDSPQRKQLVKQYRTQVYRIRDILSGKAHYVIKTLTDQMFEYARNERFEEAARTRNQLQLTRDLLALTYDPMTYEEASFGAIARNETEELSVVLRQAGVTISTLERIECIDISNISGSYAVGSLVVASDGIVDKQAYRKFRIRRINTPNDVLMIREVLERRLGHTEWQWPDLFVIDGGKPQTRAAKKMLDELGLTIPVIGLAKRMEEIVIPSDAGLFRILRLPLNHPGLHLLQRLRDEAHRFAITYHRAIRSRELTKPSVI